jgi:hypothetical protein
VARALADPMSAPAGALRSHDFPATARMPTTRSSDWPIRLPTALIRGGMPIVGAVHYGWSVQSVGFYFWVELVMIGLFLALVVLRDAWATGSRMPFALLAAIVLVGFQLPAIFAGAMLTLGLQGPAAKLAFLGTLLRDETLRSAALVQVAMTLASALAWNHRRGDAEATLGLQWETLAGRIVSTLALVGLALAAVFVWNVAGDAGDVLAERRYALAAAFAAGITWAVGDLFPRELDRITEWCLQPGKRRHDAP